MYKLPSYNEEDEEIVKQFVRDHPFAFIAGSDAANNPVATQVPLFIDERDKKLFLTGHIMRNTDHHKAFEQNQNVLAVFTGPHTYVSATWYDNPYQASTWNFMSVHAKGTIRFGNEEELIAFLKRLTLHYENNRTTSTTVFDIQNQTMKINEVVAKAEKQVVDFTASSIGKIRINANDAKAIYPYEIIFNTASLSSDFELINVPTATYTYPWGTTITLSNISIKRQ